MTRPPVPFDRVFIGLIVLAVVGFAIRLVIIWQPIPELITRYNADDMYYYLTIARQFSHGGGISFDGIFPTNGFHPLYLVLLILLQPLTAASPDLLIYLALTLLAFANIVTAFVLYALVRRVATAATGLFAAGVWLFNPIVILATLEGVETALSAMFLAFLCWLYVRYWESTLPAPQLRRAALAGVCAGLAFLARSDSILFLLALAIDAAWRVSQNNAWRRTTSWQPVGFGLLSFGIIVVPWLMWNLFTFGTILQTSGTAIAYQTHLELTDLDSQLQAIGQSAGLLAGSFVLSNLVIVSLVGLAVLCRLVFRRTLHRATVSDAGGTERICILYLILWFAFYGIYFLHRQLWYLLPAMFFGALLSVLWWNRLVNRLTATRFARRIWLAGAFLWCALVLGGWWTFWQGQGLALHPAQADGYRLALWLKENTPPASRIGSWNSGIVSYFSERTVINLDGVVNNPLTTNVIRQRKSFALNDVWQEIGDWDIRYLTDYELDFLQDARPEIRDRLIPVHQFPSSGYPNLLVTVQQRAE